jgi:hypothetical protein
MKRQPVEAGLVWLILRMALDGRRICEIAGAFDINAGIVSDICQGITPQQPKRNLHRRQSAMARARRLGLGMS